MNTPDPDQEPVTIPRQLLRNFGLLLMACGALLLFYPFLTSRDGNLIGLGLFLLGAGEVIYRKLTKPIRVIVRPVIFVFDPAVKEEERPRDEPRL
jgi:uncharacterized protein YjeT (DUF2065 family)